MKRYSVILNVVLVIAVGALYFLHFTADKPVITQDGDKPEYISDPTSSGVAYVNIDTVIDNFELFTDKMDELTERQRKAETELNTKGRAYEQGVSDYQNKVSKGLVTRATAQEMEESLMRQQQELIELRDRLQNELMEEEQVMNRQILEYITTYLDSVKNDYNYQYILARSFGGPVLYSDEAFNITSRVIEGINKKYQVEKAGGK